MHPKWNPNFFFSVFTKMHRKAISLYVVTKGDWATDQHNEETVYCRRKLWIAFVPRSRFLQTPGIKRQCRRMNEKYHKGDERTKLIDQGGSRGQRRHAFAAKRMHTCTVLHVSPPSRPAVLAASLRREIKRAKSRVWHTYLIAKATHTYTLTYYVNHEEFIVGTFKS